MEARFSWTGAPTTKEVLYAQEDLWVLMNLIDIIKRTNGDAIVRSQTPIKEIQDIQLGKDVVPPSKLDYKVVRPASLPVEGEEAPADGQAPVTTGPDKISTPADNIAGAPPVAIDLELVKNRYYDENYEPIADQETLLAYVKVAKRIPVRMRLVMDERMLNKLLVECANAPMTFEVRQFRFNPPDANDVMGGGGGSTDLGGPLRSRTLKANEYLSFDRTVELFGIIYVFNPVSEPVLKGEQGGTLPAPADASAQLLPLPRQVVLR